MRSACSAPACCALRLLAKGTHGSEVHLLVGQSEPDTPRVGARVVCASQSGKSAPPPCQLPGYGGIFS
jgi:hypothetical protein